MLRDAPIIPYIPVADMARARKFYQEKLGLEPTEVYGPEGAFYGFGQGTVAFMYKSAGAGTSKASIAFWQVKDVEAEVAALKARGVVFEEYDHPGPKTVNSISYHPKARTAWFKDSEGNTLALSQQV
jgi:predicted enzyme related to lactoylglutathione lyase